MQTANEILDFNFPHVALQNYAKNIVPKQIQNLFELEIDKLNQLTRKIGVSQFENKSQNLIPQIFRKFKAIIGENGTTILSINSLNRKELRTLSYSLYYSEKGSYSILNSPRELLIVLNTLDKFWRDSYLIGLIECYLKNWHLKSDGTLEILNDFVFNKLKNYTGSRKILSSLKSNLRFFDIKNGDLILGNEMALNKLNINTATKYISLPESWFTYPYFSKVIVSFYEKNRSQINIILEDLEKALIAHNNSSSNKRLLSKLIIQANTDEYIEVQGSVKALAFRLIGDPESTIKWNAFEGATESEISELKNARTILNEWITRQFINVFFEKCINDNRRRNFWLKYASKISSFKVFGARRTRAILKSDQRIEQYVDARFSTVYSNKETAAILLIMGNYKLVEFSDPGYAFYAYKKNNPDAPSFEAKSHRSVDDFRNSSLPLLVYRSGYYLHSYSDEGRLSHADGDLGWENVFDSWIKTKIGINV
jgi:hypothetical protein